MPEDHPPPKNLRRLDTAGDGAIWLSAMPGKLGTWAEFLDDAHRARLDIVLCLTPRHEIERLSPDYAAAIDAGRLPFDWWHLPMRDFGLSGAMDHYEHVVNQLADRLRLGSSALLHCAAGIGRTGTTAACVLVRLGVPASEALQRVRAAGSSPESATQSGLIDRFSQNRGP